MKVAIGILAVLFIVGVIILVMVAPKGDYSESPLSTASCMIFIRDVWVCGRLNSALEILL